MVQQSFFVFFATGLEQQDFTGFSSQQSSFWKMETSVTASFRQVWTANTTPFEVPRTTKASNTDKTCLTPLIIDANILQLAEA